MTQTTTLVKRVAVAAALSAAVLAPSLSHAQRVSRDADGTLRPTTPAEAKALDAKAQKAQGAQAGARLPARPVRHANGAESIQSDDSMLNYTVVRRGADGKLQKECITGEEMADRQAGKSVAKTTTEHAHEH